MYEEIILQPVNHTPAENVERIGKVEDNKFMEICCESFGFINLPVYREYK